MMRLEYRNSPYFDRDRVESSAVLNVSSYPSSEYKRIAFL